MAKMQGGMEFPQGEPIRVGPVPEYVPASPLHIDCIGRPEVVEGQEVRRGQALVEPILASEPAHVSPISATVRSLSHIGENHYRIVLEPAGETVVTSLEVSPPRGRKLSNWLSAVRRIGPWTDPDGGVGLINQLHAAQHHRIHTIVCIGLDVFPPYTDASSLLYSFPDDAVVGMLILADLVEAENAIMLAGRVPTMLTRLRSSCRKYRLRLIAHHNRYPSANATMVFRTLRLGSGSLAHAHNPVESGVMLVHPWTTIRIGRWFTLRRFDMVRPLFIAQTHAERQFMGRFAIPGQRLDRLEPLLFGQGQAGRYRLIAGNPMDGRLVGEPHVVPGDQTLLTMIPPRRRPRAEPCINCGWCVDACPTRLDPVRLLHAAVQRNDDDWLTEQLPWCIECGLCSYVCPSAIPLAQQFRIVHRELEA